MASSRKHPFKFLDAYEQTDQNIYFGREEEVEVLYHLLFQSNLVLVYGASGTGKTSLIQCGLANKFPETSWYHLFVRRGTDLNQSFLTALKERNKKIPAGMDKEEDMSWFSEYLEKESTIIDPNEDNEHIPFHQNETVQAVHELYLNTFRPIYLIFDQFEELFILGTPEEEQVFIQTIKQLIDADFPCKIILSMREEYLAELYEFEREVPSIFRNRLRVELINREKAVMIIDKACHVGGIQLEAKASIPEKILDLVTEDGRERIQFPFLQIVLVKLFHLAAERNKEKIVFDQLLLQELENKGLGDILSELLDDQIKLFKKEVHPDENMAIAFLQTLASKLGTKKPLHRGAIFEKLQSQVFTRDMILQCIDFFTKKRILRPLSQDQFELAHDSLAKRIATRDSILFNIPDLPEIPLPNDFFDPASAYDFPTSDRLASLFFERDREILILYNKFIYQKQQWLTLFGPAGAGKSALIRSGLMPYFKDILQTLYFDCRNEPDVDSLWEKLPALESEKSLLLFFDHFGELLNIRNLKKNLNFLQTLKESTDENNRIRICFIVREENFTRLMDLDNEFPALLEHRFRIKPLSKPELLKIVQSILKAWDSDQQKAGDILEQLKTDDQKFDLRQLLLTCKEVHSVPKHPTSDTGNPDDLVLPKIKGYKESNYKSIRSNRDVIFLAFADNWNDPLPELREEEDAIYQALASGALKGQYVIYRDSHTNPRQVAEKLSQYRYDLSIFHYAGYADRDALLDEASIASGEGIVRLLRQCPNLKLVVLSGCATQGQVHALLDAGVPAVLATSAPVGDSSASRFAIWFYRNLSLERTIGEAFELAKSEVLFRGLEDLQLYDQRSLLFINSYEPIWGLFLQDGYGDIIDTKLPSTNVAASQTDSFKINELLLQSAWEVLKDYSEDIQFYINRDREISLARKRMLILNNLPAPIAEQIRKLMVPVESDEGYDKISTMRLQQLSDTYKTIAQLLFFTLLSELWELNLHQKEEFQIDNLLSKNIRQFLLPDDGFDSVRLLDLINDLISNLRSQGHRFFLQELEYLQTPNKYDHPFFQSATFMESLSDILARNNIKPNEVAVLCFEGEAHLAEILKQTAFLSKCMLVAVQDIDVHKYHHTVEATFQHHIVALKDLLGGLEVSEFSLNRFLDNQSILWYNEESKSYLNLSPFIFDENSFNSKSYDIIKLYFLSNYNPDSREFSFKFSYDSRKEHPLIISAEDKNFNIIWQQLKFFMKMISSDTNQNDNQQYNDPQFDF